MTKYVLNTGPSPIKQVNRPPFKIEVTQEDIDKGEPGVGDACPVALAMMRQGFTNVSVGRNMWYGNTKEGRWFGFTSTYARRWITRFDLEREVKPFTTGLIARQLDRRLAP